MTPQTPEEQGACERWHHTRGVVHGFGCCECEAFEALKKLERVIAQGGPQTQLRWHCRNVKHHLAKLVIVSDVMLDMRERDRQQADEESAQ